MTHEIHGYGNETFTISKVDDIAHLPAIADHLVKSGKEASIYYMDRVTEGTKKRPMTVMCYRFANSGNFISVI